jgi:FkbM family methyltransferase
LKTKIFEQWELTDENIQILDIGANKGQFTKKALTAYPNATVHAFEPQSNLAVRLERLPRVKVYQHGLGSCEDTLAFNIADNSGASSFLAASDNYVRDNPNHKICNVESVDIKALDDVVTGSFFIAKIDVEGYEVEVLKGARNTLSNTKYIVIEVSLNRTDTIENLFAHVCLLLDDTHRIDGFSNVVYGKNNRLSSVDLLFAKI